MSVRYSKKHVRRAKVDAHAEYVSVDETGLLVTVHPPKWATPRTFDFTFLRPLAAVALAQAMALAFGQFATRFARSTAVTRYHEFAKLWRHIAAQSGVSSEVSNLRTGDTARWWRSAAQDYSVAQYSRLGKQTSAKTSTQNLAAVLDELASCGLLPEVPPTVPPKNLHLRKVPRPGLVELTGKRNEVSPEEKSELLRHFRSIGVHVDDAEAEEYVDILLGQMSPEERRDPAAATKAYFARTGEYLAAITAAAENEFLRWQRHYEIGQNLLQLADHSVLDAFDAGDFHQASPERFRHFFPKSNPNAARANLLLLLRERFDCCVPTEKSLKLPFRSRMNRLMRRLGGHHHTDAMLMLHRNGVAAAATLYIVDTGANVSTCLSLASDFERDTSEPGVVEFFAIKARANYKAIYDCLPVSEPGRRISTVKALRGVVEMTKTLRSNFEVLKDHLFAFRYFDKPSVANQAFLAQQFKYLLAGANLPASWTLSAVRTAVAVANVLDGTGTLKGVARKLHHRNGDAATTAGYALRWPVRKSLELSIAKYQSLFEAGVASNLQGALNWLGKSPDDADKLVSEARRTGLGFLCASPTAGARPGAKHGKDCEKTGECPGCAVRLFVVDEESLAEVIATNMSLRTNEDRLRGESAERYDAFWVELVAFTTAAIEATKRSPQAYLLPRATKKAEQWIASGFDITHLRP